MCIVVACDRDISRRFAVGSARSHVVPSVKRKECKRCGGPWGRSAEGREGEGGGDGAWRERERRNWVRHQGSEAALRCPAPRTPPALVTATPPCATVWKTCHISTSWVCGEGCVRRFGWELESGVVAQTRRYATSPPPPPLPAHQRATRERGKARVTGWALCNSLPE